MEFDPETVEVRQRGDRARFEAVVQGHKAYITYRREDGRLILDHTWVPPVLEGRGLAARLTRTAFEYARSEGLAVVPECPYVAAWVRRHPEFRPLVADRG